MNQLNFFLSFWSYNQYIFCRISRLKRLKRINWRKGVLAFFVFIFSISYFYLPLANLKIAPEIREARAAEAAVDTTIFTTNSNGHSGSPKMVWVSATEGYIFYLDSAGGISMASTTDAGVTWSNSRNVDSVNTTDAVSVAVWYDRWTQGDTTGNYIHIATTDTGVDDVYYTRLDLATGAFSASVVATTQSATFTRGATGYTSITKAQNGVLYTTGADTSDSWVASCSTTCTTSGNWSERTGAFGTTPDLGDDVPILTPLVGTNNVVLVYWDYSASTIDYNVYSATSSSWWFTATQSIVTATESNTTYEAQLLGMAVSSTTALTYLAFTDDTNDYTTQDHDIRLFTYSSTTIRWTAKTNVVTNASGGITGAKVSVKDDTGDIYVVYGRRTTIGTATTGNLYYQTSTNGGTSWSGESSALNSQADDINDISMNIMSSDRVGVRWNYTTAPKADQLFYRTVAAVPTVTTTNPPANPYGQTTATLLGGITATGGATVIMRGFVYGTDSLFSDGDTATTTNSGTYSSGDFSKAVSNLACNSLYYVRAWADNGDTIGYGSTFNFTTKSCSPAAPTSFNVPFRAQETPDQTPDFEFTAFDPDGSAEITYEIIIDNDYNFSSPIVNCTSVSGGTCSTGSGAFINTQDGGDTAPFTESQRIRFTPSTSFSNSADNTAYFWRTNAMDDSGSGGSGYWGASSTIASFRVNTGLANSRFFQTTDNQFSVNSLTGVEVDTGSHRVKLATGGTNTYSYSGILATDDNPNVFGDDVDFFPFGGDTANRNSHSEADDSVYGQIGISDDSRWQIAAPGAQDNIFIWNEFNVSDDPAAVSQIDFVFEGMFQKAVNASVYVLKDTAHASGWEIDANWTLVETSQSFDIATEATMTKSLTTNIADYIDDDGDIIWGVYEDITNIWAEVDYIKMDVTVSSPTVGTTRTRPIDFDWISGMESWNTVSWATTSPPGLTDFQFMYASSTTKGDPSDGVACDTPIPDSDLADNSSWFSSASKDLSELDTNTYNRICLRARLTDSGGTPYLNDWTLTWKPISLLTISGALYSGEGTGPLDGKSIKVAVATSTPGVFSATTVSGAWSVSSVEGLKAGMRIAVWWDAGGAAEKAFTLTKATTSASNISGLDLYQNRIILRHGGTSAATSTTIADLAFCDADSGCGNGNAGDSDIQFTANGGALNVFKGQELHIWTGKVFKPGGAVTLHGNQGSSPDGDLHLGYDSVFNAGGAITLAGSWLADNSSSTFSANGYGVTFNASTTNKTLSGKMIKTSSFAAVTFNGSGGGWTFYDNASTTSTLTISAGTVAASSTANTLLTIGAGYNNSGGAFTKNTSTVYFSGASPTLQGTMTGSSAFNNVEFQNGANFSNNASTTDFIIRAGTVTASSKLLTIAGNYTNSATCTLTGSTVYFTTGTNKTISVNLTGSNAFNDVEFLDSGSWTFSNNASTTNFSIRSGTVTAPSSGMLSIAGNYSNSGAFADNSSTVYLTGATKALSGYMTGTSYDFYNLIFTGSYTFNNNASTSNNFSIASGGSATISGTLITIGGTYANNSGTLTSNVGTVYFTGDGKTHTGTMTNSSSLGNVYIMGANTTTLPNASTTDLMIISGSTLGAPSSGMISVAGNYANNNTSGGFTDNNSTVYFTGSGKTLSGTMNSATADFYNVEFISAGAKTFSNNASTTNLTIQSGSGKVDFSGKLITVGGNYANSSTIIGTTTATKFYFNSTAAQTISGTLTNSAALPDVEFLGSGTKTISANASTTGFTIQSGSGKVDFSDKLITIAGSYSNSGTIGTTTTSKLYFNSTSAQTISGTLTGSATLADVEFIGAGAKTFSNNASTTNLTIQSGSGTVTAPSSGLVSVAGNWTNNAGDSGFVANSGNVFLSGSTGQTLAGTMTGNSAFYNLVVINNYGGGDATTSPSITFSNNASTTATFTAQVANTTVRFLASGQYTFTNISLAGLAGQPVKLRSSDTSIPPPDHTKWNLAVPNTRTISYADFMDTDASYAGNAEINASSGSNIDSGNNVNIVIIVTPPTISSEASQVFEYGQATTTISKITITAKMANQITSNNGLRIAISTSTAHMLWDRNYNTPVFDGLAKTKVSGTVTFTNGDSIAVITVNENFAINDTLEISGLAFGNFTSVNAAGSGLLYILKDGPTDTVSDGNDDKSVTIKGIVTLANRDNGSDGIQESNKFNDASVSSLSAAELFGFKLTPNAESATISNLVISLSGIRGFISNDISNVYIYADNNGDGAIGAGETTKIKSSPVSAVISGSTGTITFSSLSFSTSTACNYILVADVSGINSGDEVTFGATASTITVSGGTTSENLNPYGTVTSARHVKSAGTSGGGEIGTSAPAGITQPGGEEEAGEEIGLELLGFLLPTGNSGSWSNGQNAYASDNAYATTNVTLQSHTFSAFGINIPLGNIIDGIEIKIEASKTGVGTARINRIRFYAGGYYSNDKMISDYFSSFDATYTVGGSSDTWGRSWTAAEINSGFFVSDVTSDINAATIQVDAIWVKIYHHAGGGTPGGGGEL